ncbi:TRAFs-binding domain-containing protein [Methylobacterium sp. SyP6R]|uniref:TRAFs-binding domain-containing protein n=1 Tax=Methylobacterium sp. SyP6R TaxID=2718876 RepID=UPI001F2DD6CF|nr:TRAFs-binding domain-containing protein [Methylobacterium sp. SyP6R]MCF4127614.1 DUF4071 domain-containing protein [Methylobacterium sp. SyP6R]
MKPLCFVLMPFGTKKDESGRMIDFNAIYNRIIHPAVIAAGLDVIRADEEHVGGSIHKTMFERLMLCEYAIADLTTANPNVYYELGVRHALRPRSTVILFAEGTKLPFDVSPVRGLPYRIDKGVPTDPRACAEAITRRLVVLRDEQGDDSPVFQLIKDMLPNRAVDHEKSDLFRLFRRSAETAHRITDRLAQARLAGKQAVLDAAEDQVFADVSVLETGVVLDLYLSFRDVGAFAEMVSLYEKMARPLQGTRLVQEQFGFALNRLGRHEKAEAVLKGVIAQYGPSSETNGLLGRIYKDRWETATKAGNRPLADGAHRQAVATYLAGFEADWRDAFPGVNAVTMMEVGEEADPRQDVIVPVVRYSASRKAAGASADYWDHATLLEIAVLARDRKAAGAALADALAFAKPDAPWERETTARNLRLIRETRERRGEEVEWIAEIVAALAP